MYRRPPVSPSMAGARGMNTARPNLAAVPQHMRTILATTNGLPQTRNHASNIDADDMYEVNRTYLANIMLAASVPATNSLLINSGIGSQTADYRRLNEARPSWEDLRSAPADMTEFTMEDRSVVAGMRVTAFSRVAAVDRHGHTNDLSNVIAMDVTPAENPTTSSGGSFIPPVGEMRRTRYPVRIRRSLEEADIDSIRRAVNFDPGHRSVTNTPEFLNPNSGPAYRIVCRERSAAAMMGPDSATDRIGGAEATSLHARSKLNPEAEDRFYLILQRLNHHNRATSLCKENNRDIATSPQTRGPSVVAAPQNQAQTEQQQAREPDAPDNGRSFSADSSCRLGSYSTESSSTDQTSASSTINSCPESPTRKLNPKAAEFTSTDKDKMEKSTSRLPVVGSSHATSTSAQPQPSLFPPALGSSAHLDNHVPVGGGRYASPVPMAPGNNLVNPAPLLQTTRLYPGSVIHQLHILEPSLSAPVVPTIPPASTNGYHNLPPSIRAYLSRNTQQSVTPVSMVPAQGYNRLQQYPSANIIPQNRSMGGYGPVVPSFSVTGAATVVTAATAAPTAPYFSNPHIPQRPRGNDPVAQQEYEAFLEHRKMFEPGFHQAARARQASRFARQCA